MSTHNRGARRGFRKGLRGFSGVIAEEGVSLTQESGGALNEMVGGGTHGQHHLCLHRVGAWLEAGSSLA